MRDLTRALLVVLTTTLALWLVLGFGPVSAGNRFALIVCILLICGTALWRLRRHYQGHLTFSDPTTVDSLPPEDFPGAVVLVCGDTVSLFTHDEACRETHAGWYLKVPDAGQLPLLAQQLAAVRPALISQISILLAVAPERHTEEARFTGSLREWRRSITQCRAWLNGLPPVWSVIWVNAPEGSERAQWFTAMPELAGIQARQAGHVALSVTDWQQEAGSASRLFSVLWLDSVLRFTSRMITCELNTRQNALPPLSFCASGVCLTPVSALTDNLWQQQIAGITTLSPDSCQSGELLPLPDVLLPALPCRHGVSRRMREAGLAALIVFTFLALAMLASFINNQRLVRSVGEHLMAYQQLSGQPPAPKAQAQHHLRADSQRLDDWLRRGEPLRYGLGLYQGMKLIPPLEAALNDWAPPLPPAPIKTLAAAPQTVRLDSLSLFDTGQWRLRPGSTKVLVSALMGIRAKPGWLIVVAGHTDDVGDARANQQLSRRRAESVRDWMRDTGDVPESCFAVQGYGESRPVASNATAAGRALNRRVEIRLVPQADACQAPDITLPPSQDERGN
ncbi:OmpA family protein [Cronobacter muytjensii]|nr:OmpA family protein [Cronobacter muytjensii]